MAGKEFRKRERERERERDGEREREKKRLVQAGGQAGVLKWLERCWRKQLAPRQRSPW